MATKNFVEKKEIEINCNSSKCLSKLEQLFNAARTGNILEILNLYNKNVNLTMQNEDGNTALHIAAMNGHSLVCRFLIVFSTPTNLWKIKNKRGLIAEHLANNERIQKDLQDIEMKSPRKEENDRLFKSIEKLENSTKVLLSLDGGGIKVLGLIQILIYLESYIEGGFLEKIDMIAGTSCGGITALMIGKGYTLEFMRQFFFEMRTKVFCGNKEKYPKHSSSGFEEVAQNIFGTQAKMNSLSKKILVTVADTLTTPPNLVLFRSYIPNIPKDIAQQHHYLDPSRILVWKAARCTSAAPYFFESYNGLSDGGLVANNPTQTLMSDFFNITKLEYHYSKTQMNQDKIGVVISIGTGIGPPEKTSGIDLNFKSLDKKNPIRLAKGLMNVVATAKNAFHLLIKEVTSSQGTPVRNSRAWCHSLNIPYYRLNPNLSMDLALDCTNVEKIVNMMWETEIYLRCSTSPEVDQLSYLLKLKENNSKIIPEARDSLEVLKD